MIKLELQIPEELGRASGKLASFDAIADRELRQAMQMSTVTWATTAKGLAPVYRGDLRRSIESSVTSDGRAQVVGKVGSSLKGEVYPAVVEFGRKPGTYPPLAPIMRWVHLVLKPNPKSEYAVARGVQRAIAKRGIKAKRFMRGSFDELRTYFVNTFHQAMEAIAKGIRE